MIVANGLWGGEAEPPCLLDSLGRTVQDTPDAWAVLDGELKVSYVDLIGWIGRIAELLVDAGVGVGDRVAVLGARSAAVVAAMWATVGVGATYVPLDREYPARQLAYMLADCGANLLLYTGTEPANAPGMRCVRIPDPSTGADAPAEPSRWSRVGCGPDTPVYLIYTSGSTGNPKGVALPHRSIDNMAHWQRSHSVQPNLRTAQFAPLNFDVWFQEVLGTHCGGGTLVIMPERLRRDAIALLDWLAAERIERLFVPCVALHMLTLAATDLESVARLSLQEVNTAGEQLVCTPAIREFFRRLPDCRLNNHYGQSESAMVTVHTLTGASDSWPALPPIGRPLPGCELLLDVTDPADVHVGELLVAGLPMSIGYLNQPDRTAERYVSVPRTPHGHTRAFRTGDVVRVTDGVVQFLARTDHEVKIRGYRVNPLEVDACLAEQPGVREAVCVAVQLATGSRQLRAAVTVTGREDFHAERTTAALREVLPAHSVPASITVLSDLPRTPSGKVDREAVARRLARPS